MPKFKRTQEIKVGVIGYGGAFNMGRTHLTQMKEARMTPVAVAELDPARLEVASRDFPGIQTYGDVGKMLRTSDVNLVVIITPHNTHARLARQCLKAGRHVITEKPFAVTTAECDAMIRDARARSLLLSTYHNRHWDGCVLEALNLIRRKGVIGEVYRIDAHMGGYGPPGDWWRGSKSISGGILYDWGVHLLEYALQLMGDDIVEVTGFAHTGHWASASTWKADTNEDEATAVIRFRKRGWINLTITNLDANPRKGWLDIYGTRGVYNFDSRTYEITTVEGERRTVVSGQNRPSEWGRYCRNIASHLVKGTQLIITPEWARRPIHILDLANRSARAGRTLRAKHK